MRLVWGGERKCCGYKPQGAHKESHSTCLQSSRWFSSSALTLPKDGANFSLTSNNRKPIAGVHPLQGCTHCRGGFCARVSSVASLKASVCHHKGVSRAGEDVLAMRGKFHSARAETFHFHLVSSVLSCESYIRCETAVKTNICTLMEWNISSIFPFLK